MYIDLSLKKHSNETEEIISFNDALQESRIIVILGAPGSGKTSLLKKYYQDHPSKTKFIKIKSFLKFPVTMDHCTEIVLLDGLDESRCFEKDEIFLMVELAHRIQELPDTIKVVITCREMDWYGESDIQALKDVVGNIANVYKIQPMNELQQKKLAELHSVDNIEIFMRKFSSHGFLSNPQMFTMLVKLYKNNPEKNFDAKSELYKEFIITAREHNISHNRRREYRLEPDEMLKYVGYIAFFYMFSDIGELGEDLLDKICDTSNGYPKEKLEATLRTALFAEHHFIHRTIAEFAAAMFIKQYKLSESCPSSFLRVKNMFAYKGKVATELRGTYAWLCSLSRYNEFIKIDPYYQLVYGDPSLFNDQQKREILLEIKKYSLDNPYFWNFNRTEFLSDIYNPEFDDFFIDELEEGLRLDNHYVYLVTRIVVSNTSLSTKMIDFLKKKIVAKGISPYYKTEMLEGVSKDKVFLTKVLDLIKNRKIEDGDNTLKDKLLELLYPDHLSLEKVVEYLMMYQESSMGGHGDFLFRTRYEHKFELIDRIYQLSKCKSGMEVPKIAEFFIKDYFYETILKFEEGLSASEIYNILKHFKQYYRPYKDHPLEPLFTMEELVQKNLEKLQRLADELFSLYVDDILKSNSEICKIHEFQYLFPICIVRKKSEILFEKMNLNFDADINQKLFHFAFCALPKENQSSENIKAIAQRFQIVDIYEELLYPPEEEWMIEYEKNNKKRKENDRNAIIKNDEYFKNRSDNDIVNINLVKIAEFIFCEKAIPVSENTQKRLKYIIKNLYNSDRVKIDNLDIYSLIEDNPMHMVYYVSCSLNTHEELSKLDTEIQKYIYVNCILHSNICGIIKNDFVKYFNVNNSKLAKESLKCFLQYTIAKKLPSLKNVLLSYFEKEIEIEQLIEMAVACKSNVNYFVEIFLRLMAFQLDLRTLQQLEEYELTDENKDKIRTLIIFLEGKKEEFIESHAIILSEFCSPSKYSFHSLSSDMKVRAIDYMISCFNTPESIEYVSGLQSARDLCATFLRRDCFYLLNLGELQELKIRRRNENDVWTHLITNRISELIQQEADSVKNSIPIKNLKEFIISDTILSKEDFFIDVCCRLNELKKTIEDNRDNDKDAFYNQDGSSKDEEFCRDTILRRLKDRYRNDLDMAKERYEANNRVDINIRYNGEDFEIQIECKKDSNRELYTSIKSQLIDKYFSSNVQYGIYLIFNFSGHDSFLKRVKDSIPIGYENNIEVICIDLAK